MNQIFYKVYNEEMTGKQLRAYVIEGKRYYSLADVSLISGYENTGTLRNVVPKDYMRQVKGLPLLVTRGTRIPFIIDQIGLSTWLSWLLEFKPNAANYLQNWFDEVYDNLWEEYEQFKKSYAEVLPVQLELEAIKKFDLEAAMERIESKLDLIIKEFDIKQ